MHAVLNDGLDKVLFGMRKSLIIEALQDVSILFLKKKGLPVLPLDCDQNAPNYKTVTSLISLHAWY